jgi:hypothetical protein
MQGNALLFIGRDEQGKHLFVAASSEKEPVALLFNGEPVNGSILGNGFFTWRCPLDHGNALRLRDVFPFTSPVLLGLDDSFGFGDRLGIANPAHLRSLAGSHMRPILAQQSIRELDRTRRTAEDVLDAASWAAFQEGFTAGFGADADHLKTTDDIDRYARAGFTMFTFDPSAHVINEAATLPMNDVHRLAREKQTGDLDFEETMLRYAGQTIRLDDGSVIQPDSEQIARAFLKYGSVIAYARLLYRYLKSTYPRLKSEVELSVDETDIPTTPTEHLLIASELKRLGVTLVSLAPRFIGDFEKGVDYRGDLSAFAAEYRLHAGIAKKFGPYKISIHSGSDKFGVYRTIGSLRLGNVHVKTAGTSYLEALRTIARVEPPLIRDILDFARSRYEEDRKSYHVTGRLDRVPVAEGCSDAGLLALFDQHDARQVFHVTFGKVLTETGPDGNRRFCERIMAALDRHEEEHYETIIRHFRKHLDPFARS